MPGLISLQSKKDRKEGQEEKENHQMTSMKKKKYEKKKVFMASDVKGNKENYAFKVSPSLIYSSGGVTKSII